VLDALREEQRTYCSCMPRGDALRKEKHTDHGCSGVPTGDRFVGKAARAMHACVGAEAARAPRCRKDARAPRSVHTDALHAPDSSGVCMRVYRIEGWRALRPRAS
jgi:hypothetical protein